MDIKWRGIITGLLIVAGITVVFLAMYAAVQQNYRQSADDPQIQMAEDVAAALSNGTAVYPLVAIMPKVDMSKSLAPFVMVFDDSGKLTISSAVFAGSSLSVPVPPSGVFGYVRANGEDRVTWQIPSGQRYAAVIARYPSGFVVAARSLREVENRQAQLELMLGTAWMATLVIGVITVLVMFVCRRKKVG